ncbi:LysR family transcriptional regulator, partial [Pseudomonas oryzihabitans]
MKSLDVDAVQAFVTIAELRSFTRAAEVLGSTQGALSIKLKRLEKRLDERLLERTPRQVRLSVGGERFLPRARDFLAAHEQALAALSDQPSRRFTLGIAIHLFGPEVPTLLARLKALDPCLTLEVSVDDAPALLGAYDKGEFDAVIIRSDDDSRQGEVLGPEHFGWYAAADFAPRP